MPLTSWGTSWCAFLVTSRLAAMYFDDYHGAFQEALRVLRRGGRATYLVW
jgi:ubiquinone/menaquinone biosynthesis C-methylase UbiE